MNKLTASDAQADDRFGKSVAISGETDLVGARFEDTGGSNAGAAYVFQEPVPTPTSTSTPTPTPTDTPTPTHTATPVPPTPIGGIGIFPGTLDDGADAGGAAVLTSLAAGAAAGALALGGAAWYARRRWR